MPLRSQLKNGYQVEIITSKAQTPSPTWESFVVTGKARACIRRFVRSQQRQEYVRLGREIVEKAFRQEGYELAEKALRGRSEEHTSELQSLMRISYAVFCLKKKKTNINK